MNHYHFWKGLIRPIRRRSRNLLKHTLRGSKRVFEEQEKKDDDDDDDTIQYNGPTSIPDYWISLTGRSRPPRRINTPRHHGRAPLKSPRTFGARWGNFGPPDPGFVFLTLHTTSHAREKGWTPVLRPRRAG